MTVLASLPDTVDIAFEYKQPRYEAKTGQFVRKGKLINRGTQPVPAPISAVMTHLEPANASLSLANPDGALPDGSPYQVLLRTGQLASGQQWPVEIRFRYGNQLSGGMVMALTKAADQAFPGFITPKADAIKTEIQLQVLAPGNRMPLAYVDGDRSCPVGATVHLEGGGSRDPDGDSMTYAWLLSQTPNGSQAGLASASPTASQFVADRAGTYLAYLLVNDGNLFSSPVSVRFTATRNELTPNINPHFVSFPAITATGTRRYSYRLMAEDPDGDPLTFSAVNVPAGMSVSPAGEVVWIPPNPSASYAVVNVSVRVSDGRCGFAIQSYSLQVNKCSCI